MLPALVGRVKLFDLELLDMMDEKHKPRCPVAHESLKYIVFTHYSLALKDHRSQVYQERLLPLSIPSERIITQTRKTQKCAWN